MIYIYLPQFLISLEPHSMLLTSGVPLQFFAPLTYQLYLMELLTSLSLKPFCPPCTPPPSSESPPLLAAPPWLGPQTSFSSLCLLHSRVTSSSLVLQYSPSAGGCNILPRLSFPSELQTCGFPLPPAWFIVSEKHLQPHRSSLQSPPPPGYLQAAFSLSASCTDIFCDVPQATVLESSLDPLSQMALMTILSSDLVGSILRRYPESDLCLLCCCHSFPRTGS